MSTLKNEFIAALRPLQSESDEIKLFIEQLQDPEYKIPETDYENVVLCIGYLLNDINQASEKRRNDIKKFVMECCEKINARAQYIPTTHYQND